MSGAPAWFARLMVTLAEAYPSVRLREGTVRMYAAQLADLTPEQVEAAMGAAVRECEFFPTVAALRRLVVGTSEEAALRAWTGLVRAAAAVGAWASLEVDDPCAAAAVCDVFGSWPAFCELEEGPALAQRRQEFLAAYRAAARRLRAEPPRRQRLRGLCEATGAYVGGPAVAVGRLDGGVVTVAPDLPAAEGADGHKRIAAGEAGAAAAYEGASGPAGGGRREGGPGGGHRA